MGFCDIEPGHRRDRWLKERWHTKATVRATQATAGLIVRRFAGSGTVIMMVAQDRRLHAIVLISKSKRTYERSNKDILQGESVCGNPTDCMPPANAYAPLHDTPFLMTNAYHGRAFWENSVRWRRTPFRSWCHTLATDGTPRGSRGGSTRGMSPAGTKRATASGAAAHKC
jgi:hypothetical protein